MPSPTSAIDLIKTAMKIIGVLAQGETPSADQSTDGLRALNDILERWSIESLAVYGSLPDAFVTVGGQSTYTFGPGGDWNVDRPIGVDAIYSTYQGVDFPASEWSLEEYGQVGLKTMQQPIVQRWVFVNDAPLARVILYPTPSEAVPITVTSARLLTNVPTIATTMTLPPGYVSALQYALAAELVVQYGSPIDVTSRAKATLALVKRANRSPRVMGFDPALGQRGSGASIYAW